MSQCWPCAASRHCMNCEGCCKARKGRSPMSTGDEFGDRSGCALWTLMTIGFIVALIAMMIS